MPRDFDTRLSRALARRQDLTKGLNEALAINLEPQWKRSNQKSVRYAFLAMAELDDSYTRKSYEEGDRVINQLKSKLGEAGLPVDFEYQGSVPLNIHIRFQSDIDVLVLSNRVLTYNSSGPRASHYTPTNLVAKEEVKDIRRASEAILTAAYPAAQIDITGRKSITLSGGSLSRKVDIVPAHWHDDIEYQRTMDKVFRKVCIWNKSEDKIIENLPFLHMARINEKERDSSGGTKKIVRLLKTLRADAEPRVEISSYDIASIVWHFDSDSMRVIPERDLTLVAIARDNLEYLVNNKSTAEGLMTPDGTRRILNESGKYDQLRRLFAEVKELSENIADEIESVETPLSKALGRVSSGGDVSRVLREAYIPR
ncbi:hypothetical protein [Ferrovibrio sp.]|uniref:hypothetical protein n=1 Tax=Ferrovibrio sp. TaxID=1917215 RepID=UPI003517D06B